MKIRVSTRVVLVFEKKVIKIPISYRGYLQCKNEKFIWDKYKDTGMLAELYSERFGIVVMKRYKPTNVLVSETEAHRFIDTVVGIKHLIPEFDIDNCDLYRAENWGKSGDDYVLIDYGINERISKMY